MFDTMTLTKALGAVCGSLLVFLLGSWAAESLFHIGGHGDETQAYVIDTGGDDAAVAVVEEGPDFDTLLASADIGAGEKVFAKCQACHKVNGADGTGPHLNGVVNRQKAAVDGFAYSDAILAVADEVWTAENLNGFLLNPRSYMPGTKMVFAGLGKDKDRADVIAFLASTTP